MGAAEFATAFPWKKFRFKINSFFGISQRTGDATRLSTALKRFSQQTLRIKKQLIGVNRVRYKGYQGACDKSSRVYFFQPQSEPAAPLRRGLFA